MADQELKTLMPPIKAYDNGDGTYSIAVKDINSDAILTAAGG